MLPLQRHLSVAGLILACAVIVALVARVHSLEEQAGQLYRHATQARPGLDVPTFNGVTLLGDSVQIAPPAGRVQVLFMFTTTCPFCRESLPQWKAIANQVEEEHLGRVVGVVLDSIHLARDYVRNHDIPFPVIQFPDERTRRMYRAGTVPEIVVLDGRAAIAYARIGVLTAGEAVDSVLEVIAKIARERKHSTTEASDFQESPPGSVISSLSSGGAP